MASIDYEQFRTKLDRVPCKPRLYPTRVFALQLLVGKKFDKIIDIKIVQPLSKATELGWQIQYEFTRETVDPDRVSAAATWVHQFIRDFAVYGLREAILYFRTYEFLSDPSELIENAISAYHDIAKSYLDNVDRLETSHDETIRKLMLAARSYGEGIPQDVKARYVPRTRKPKRKKVIPRHPNLESLMPALVPYKEPTTDEDKLMEFIDVKFITEGFPGFEDGVLQVAEFLNECGFDIKTKEGQNILQTWLAHIQEEFYGDFNRFTWCDNCGEEFKPVYSLEYADQVLEHKVLCPKCSEEERSHDA